MSTQQRHFTYRRLVSIQPSVSASLSRLLRSTIPHRIGSTLSLPFITNRKGKTMSNVGVPIKLLYEAEGMKITAEMKNGEIYRGLLLGAEDTMNVSLSDVLRTARNGQISKLPNVYLRGSSIRFIALPDLLKSAPMFQKVATQKRKMEEAAAQRQGGAPKKRKRD
jgi:small nuclear ribonucleoprotein D3